MYLFFIFTILKIELAQMYVEPFLFNKKSENEASTDTLKASTKCQLFELRERKTENIKGVRCSLPSG
ncbi:MAG: hypothetical protein COA38_13365 [Fluviicola sp.]|nr:MAG: hypothetical protein COA38_13365 [Fluviicola sp.]